MPVSDSLHRGSLRAESSRFDTPVDVGATDGIRTLAGELYEPVVSRPHVAAREGALSVAPRERLTHDKLSGFDRLVRERRFDEALNPAVSADEAEEIIEMNSAPTPVAERQLIAPAAPQSPGECIKCDSATLDQAIEERFTPFKETVDELIRKRLTKQQLRAIDLILAGVSDCAAARALGVHRVTLGRWRRYHPAFVAELNRRRDVDLQSAADRLRGLSQRAISILEERMANADNPEAQMRAAIALLRLNGIGRIAQRVGETSADDLIEKQALANRKTKRGPVDHGEREDVLVDLARRAESAEVEEVGGNVSGEPVSAMDNDACQAQSETQASSTKPVSASDREGPAMQNPPTVLAADGKELNFTTDWIDPALGALPCCVGSSNSSSAAFDGATDFPLPATQDLRVLEPGS